MRDIVIGGWDDLQKAIFDGVWDESIMRYRNNRVFRGAANSAWGLTPSLHRACAHNLALEKQMLRSFRKYGYSDIAQCQSFWQVLAMAQQHGLPTRLLDLTYSPLVAAHFATEDVSAYDRDGAIWCVNTELVNAQLPPALKELLATEHANIFTMEMLDRVGDGFEALAQLSETPFALFFEPASMVDRIANQYALFAVLSAPEKSLADLPGVDEAIVRIVIPKEVKLEIRDKLDYINISERMIYPGLDGVCKWITRRYAALGPVYNKKP